MSVDKLVDSTQLDADLTSVANAIRTKGGTSASLSFPSGFVSAINSIPTGGGGGYEIKGGTVTPSSSVSSFKVEVDFEPQYAVCFTDPFDMDATSSWKVVLILHDRADGFGSAMMSRYNNNAWGSNTAGMNQTNIGAYSNGEFTFQRFGTYNFLSGVTYHWFCMRART